MFFVDTKKCWEWTGAKTQGYGVSYSHKRDRQSVLVRVHRFLHSYFSGEKYGRWDFACHKCNNRGCFNPEHIYKGTAASNSKDMIEAKVFHKDKSVRHRKKLHKSLRKPIIDQLGNKYSSVKEAAKKTGFSRRNISNNLNGWSKAVGHGKYIFSYDTCAVKRTSNKDMSK